MAHNRRRRTNTIHLAAALKALVLCSLLGASSVGYVIQRNKIHKLGQEMRQREIRLEQLRKDILVLNSQNAELLSPPRLQARMEQFNIDLDLPQPNQQVWLRRPTLNHNHTHNVPLENLVLGGASFQKAMD